MKTQIAVGSYVASSYSECPTETWHHESNRNGSRSFLPTPNLQLRPMSAGTGWNSARSKNSGLPASLKNWLASKAAVLIG
jgi:hypothetical protein